MIVINTLTVRVQPLEADHSEKRNDILGLNEKVEALEIIVQELVESRPWGISPPDYRDLWPQKVPKLNTS